MSKNKKLVLVLLVIAALIAIIPFFARRGAAFGGSDDAGSQVVEEISPDYEPWATPVLETPSAANFPGRWKACCSASRPGSA